MNEVYTAQHLVEAHLVRDMLEAAGISARIEGEFRPGLPPDAPPFNPVVEVLNPEDVEEALALVAVFRQQQDARPDTWACPACQEVVDARDLDCWKCGASRYARL